jgi:hypothetical protein
MNPEITQFDIIQSKLLQQLKKKQNKKMLIYEITILNIALIKFIMIVNITLGDCFYYCRCQLGTIIVLDLE